MNGQIDRQIDNWMDNQISGQYIILYVHMI